MCKKIENVFINTSSLKFIFKTMKINHLSCLSSYKLSKDPSKSIGLHSTLVVGNYATFDGFVNGVDNIFKASITYNDKTITWKIFQNFKIGILIKI